jgi:DNA end-binding protein Ku
MRFADELADISQFNFPASKGVRSSELDMAKALVNSLAGEWDPGKYTDEYRDNLMRIIQGKVKGKHVSLTPTSEPREAEVVDLMERLRRSLEQGGSRGKSARQPASKSKPADKAKAGNGVPTRSRKKRAA